MAPLVRGILIMKVQPLWGLPAGFIGAYVQNVNRPEQAGLDKFYRPFENPNIVQEDGSQRS